MTQHHNKTISLTEVLSQPSLLTGAVAVAPGECHVVVSSCQDKGASLAIWAVHSLHNAIVTKELTTASNEYIGDQFQKGESLLVSSVKSISNLS